MHTLGFHQCGEEETPTCLQSYSTHSYQEFLVITLPTAPQPEEMFKKMLISTKFQTIWTCCCSRGRTWLSKQAANLCITSGTSKPKNFPQRLFCWQGPVFYSYKCSLLLVLHENMHMPLASSFLYSLWKMKISPISGLLISFLREFSNMFSQFLLPPLNAGLHSFPWFNFHLIKQATHEFTIINFIIFYNKCKFHVICI